MHIRKLWTVKHILCPFYNFLSHVVSGLSVKVLSTLWIRKMTWFYPFGNISHTQPIYTFIGTYHMSNDVIVRGSGLEKLGMHLKRLLK